MTWVTLLDLEQGGALQLTGQTSFCIEEKGNKVVWHIPFKHFLKATMSGFYSSELRKISEPNINSSGNGENTGN